MEGNLSTLFFYLGTFTTSFGSLLFVMAIPAFFLSSGFSSEIIGIAIGIHRFSGIAASAWFGPQIDRLNSRKVVFASEFLAAFASIGLIWSWLYRDIYGIWPFCGFIGLRALIIGIQSASRNRLVKLISSDNQTREASLAIWLNKVTQGAHVISSLAAIPLVSSGNILLAIVIDGLSFIIGGVSALQLPDIDAGDKRTVSGLNFLSSLSSLVKANKLIFFQDQILALAVSGTILLMVKLSGGDSKYIIYFNLLFGSSIWLSSLVAHNSNLRAMTIPYWMMMFAGFIIMYSTQDSKWIWPAYFLTYMGYWILYHKYTVEFQTQTSKDMIGAIMAARGLAIAITLSAGELLGGYATRIFDLKTELVLRGLLCLLVVISLAFFGRKLKKA